MDSHHTARHDGGKQGNCGEDWTGTGNQVEEGMCERNTTGIDIAMCSVERYTMPAAIIKCIFLRRKIRITLQLQLRLFFWMGQ